MMIQVVFAVIVPVLILAVEQPVTKLPVQRQKLENPIPLTELFGINENSQDARDMAIEGIRYSNAYTV
jgi:hypothetical protein